MHSCHHLTCPAQAFSVLFFLHSLHAFGYPDGCCYTLPLDDCCYRARSRSAAATELKDVRQCGVHHYGCHVADRGHSDHFCMLAIISLCGGPATKQANKSGGTLATTQSIHDSAEKSHIVVKDEHHCCRALLLASYAVVRSGSNGKQGSRF